LYGGYYHNDREFEVLGSHSGATYDSSLLRYDAMTLGEWLTTFRRVAKLVSSEVNKSKKNSLTLEDEGTTFLRNVENHSLSDTATHCSRTESSIKFSSIY